MREEISARFFEGSVTGAELARDIEGSEKRLSDVASLAKIEDMKRDFTVTKEMAIALCDAVLNGELEPHGLATIGFALMASDRFLWNGEDVLGEIIADWACPEVNGVVPWAETNS